MPPTIDDLFPPSQREFYRRAPLVAVTCQVRFPPLLVIESQPPAAFQEAIRQSFPLFERGGFSGMSGLPAGLQQMLNGQMGGSTYLFHTMDRAWTVTLTGEALSLHTTKYSIWDEFVQYFELIFESLKSIYSVNVFSRIGLQYQDAINREEIGLEGVSWSKLISQRFNFGLGIPDFEEDVEGMLNSTLLNLPDALGKVTARTGYANVSGKTGISFVLDFDFFQEGQFEADRVRPIIDQYHAVAGRAFRSALLEPLRTAMGPEPLPDR